MPASFNLAFESHATKEIDAIKSVVPEQSGALTFKRPPPDGALQ
ncbi:MAG: hypothetical protein Q7T70_17735 [Polaromonas sp.]|nr:hypothetical protein [Polaromonas sp.]